MYQWTLYQSMIPSLRRCKLFVRTFTLSIKSRSVLVSRDKSVRSTTSFNAVHMSSKQSSFCWMRSLRASSSVCLSQSVSSSQFKVLPNLSERINSATILSSLRTFHLSSATQKLSVIGKKKIRLHIRSTVFPVLSHAGSVS